MANKPKKSCFIIFILFVFLIVLALALSQWTTSLPKLDLGGFSSKELFKAGQQKAKEGDLKTAQKYILAALDKDSTNITYLGELATVKYKLEDYQGALKEYDKILKTGDYNGFALNGMANIYRDQADKSKDTSQIAQYTKKAYETYQQGIKDDPKYIALYSNYAIMLISADKKSEAKKIVEQGIVATGAPELKQLLKTIQN